MMYGPVAHDQLPLYYALGEVYVHTSAYEGMGRVFAEASAAGLPLVAMNVTAVERSDRGWCVRLSHRRMATLKRWRSGSSFCCAIRRRRTRLGEAARKIAFERYAAEHYIEAWVDVWKQAVELGMRSPMNLLLFNLATDADDPLLGFTTEWINRLAAHYDCIDVITMRAGRLAVAPNVTVYSVGKERGYSEPRRLVEFYRTLWRLRHERTYAACFAHMMPLFALLGAPLLRDVPITLWYTHRQAHLILRLATRVSTRVVTAGRDSFPLATGKLRVLGHGIDTDFFTPLPARVGEGQGERGSCYVVHVARLMPIKHQATLIRALPEVPAAHAVFVGDVPPETDTRYRDDLMALARDLGVAERVTFAGNQPREGVRNWLREAAVAVNLSPAGLFDKAALEGMAVGVPTILSSAAFDDLLGGDQRLQVPSPDDHVALAAHLRDLLALSAADRQAMGAALRQRVIAAHSLDRLIGRLVQVLNTGEIA